MDLEKTRISKYFRYSYTLLTIAMASTILGIFEASGYLVAAFFFYLAAFQSSSYSMAKIRSLIEKED